MTDRPSKFSSIIAAHKQRGEPEPPLAEQVEQRQETQAPAPRPERATPQRKKEPPTVSPGRGRPAGGKRSDPDFTQVTAYVREETYRKVKIALLQERNQQEFSDLVESLLQQWLRTRKSKNAEV